MVAYQMKKAGNALIFLPFFFFCSCEDEALGSTGDGGLSWPRT